MRVWTVGVDRGVDRGGDRGGDRPCTPHPQYNGRISCYGIVRFTYGVMLSQLIVISCFDLRVQF